MRQPDLMAVMVSDRVIAVYGPSDFKVLDEDLRRLDSMKLLKGLHEVWHIYLKEHDNLMTLAEMLGAPDWDLNEWPSDVVWSASARDEILSESRARHEEDALWEAEMSEINPVCRLSV